MTAKRRYLRRSEADAMGLPNLSGHIKGNKVFLRYQMNEKTGHIEAKYISLSARHRAKVKGQLKKFKFLTRYKMFVGCALCGYKEHPSALHFDHIDPKEKSFGISRGYKSKGIDTIKKEMRKCQVLCANCHAVKTFENGDYRNAQTTKK